MQKPYNLTLKFSIICAATLICFGITTSMLISSLLEKNMLQRTEQLTATTVLQEVRNEFLPAELIHPKTGADYDKFKSKVEHLSLGPNIERIKLWNTEFEVVWSDDKKIVGQNYPDNHELSEALSGSVVSEFSDLNKTEQNTEKHHGQLLELYVPIHSEGSDEIYGVFEIYLNLTQLHADIVQQKKMIWIWTTLIFSAVFFVLFSVVWRASRKMNQQYKDIINSEERYHGLVDSVQDGIIAIDRSNQIVLFNPAAEKIFNCSAKEMYGQSITRLIPDANRAKHLSGVDQYFKSETLITPQNIREYQGQSYDGKLLPLEMSFSTTTIGQEPIMIAILRDISERKAIEEQLIKTEKAASVSLIAGSIGHEIGNAIGGLLGYGELLKKRPSNQELATKCAEAMISQSERFCLYAKNLLSLSKPTKPKMRLLNFNFLLDQVTDMLTSSGLLKAFTVNKNYESELFEIWGDEHLLEQVIRNLEINAIHAMANNGILTINTGYSEDRTKIELTISDTGCGIDPETLQEIYQPFFTTKEHDKGTGLGMYIVKQIVEQHEGEINMQSTIGIGTSVTVTLPIAQSE